MKMDAKRYGIIAGSGVLPVTLAQRLAENETPAIVVGIADEADAALCSHDYVALPVEKITYALPYFKRHGVTHAIFAGGVKRRPRFGSLRIPVRLWPEIPVFAKALLSGDDNALSLIVRMFERHGIKIVGAHEILPDHVAAYGVIAGVKPKASLDITIKSGVAAAKIIGAHDIGQAVVALGRRVVAVEGIEGTDQMLARVALLRAEGRIQPKDSLVLVKIAKPGQELRADMPVIGPATVDGCNAAGISLICISAGTTMIMEVGRTLENAKQTGLNIFGINPDEWSDTHP